MRIKSRRMKWTLGLVAVAVLPIGMTLAVMAAFLPREPAAPVPRIVAAWASGPMEARVAFDRAVAPTVLDRLAGRSIRFAPAVVAPLEAGRPGGDDGSIRVAAARLDDSGRTLILVTDPHPRDATYTLTVEGIKSPEVEGSGRSFLATYSLAGVEATWTAAGADQPGWSGWWPELDPHAVHAALSGSVEHDRLWPLLRQPGKLVLRSFVTVPNGPTRSEFKGNVPFEVSLGSESGRSDKDFHAGLKSEASNEAVELTVALTTSADGPEPELRWLVGPADAPAGAGLPSPRGAFGVAWVPPPPASPVAPMIPPGLATGGDPARGAVVFSGEQAKCATCHQVRGQGGHVGPDLSNLAGANRAWVYQNISEPSASIHPDYLAYTVALKDGRISMGIVRAEGADALRVGDIDARFTTFPRAEVEEIRPSASSIMPVGLLGAIGEDQTRDLLAFLTNPTARPKPAPGHTP